MKIEDWNWSEETPHRRRLRRLKIGYYDAMRNRGLALAETGESEWTQSSVQFR